MTPHVITAWSLAIGTAVSVALLVVLLAGAAYKTWRDR